MNYQKEQLRELIIVTEHFAPSSGATAQLINDLADDLHDKGVHLRILTSTHGSSHHAYPIHRFSDSSHTSVGIFRKLSHGIRFFLGSLKWLLCKNNANNSLLIVSNPPFIGLIGILVRLLRGTRYIFLYQDIFPRSAILTGILPARGPLAKLWHLFLLWTLRLSEATVVLSQSMISRCSKEYGQSNIQCISNWPVLLTQEPSRRENKLSQEWGLSSSFTVQYSGNFGRLHDIMTILEASRILSYTDIKFLFIGDGAKRGQILQYRDYFNLHNLLLKPFQSRELLSLSLATSDLSIVSLIPGAEDTVSPSKLYGILASARPILLISNLESELAQLIKRYSCGFVLEQGDVLGLADVILESSKNPGLLQSMGENSRQCYLDLFTRSKSSSEYYSLLAKHEFI